MTLHNYWVMYRGKKALKDLRNSYRLYEDLLDELTRDALELRFRDAEQTIAGHEFEDIPAVIKLLEEELKEARPKQPFPWAAEMFDIVVSALAVAFCFRAYFYEPFRIPTGSMQPTLYGIHSETVAKPDKWDVQPWRFFKWCMTGTTWEEVKIKRGGVVSGYASSATPGYAVLVIDGRTPYEIPDDAARELAKTLVPGTKVHTGQVVWRGYVTSGDFLFVNRWIWNFRHPELGETIVFSTQGLDGLPDNQHYIKRLCGTPGDEVQLRANSTFLWINGEEARKPLKLAEIGEQVCAYPGAPRYLGYQKAQPGGQYRTTYDYFLLGPGEYLALGDNTGNSLDSRYWGKVPAKNLLGPASFVHWPFLSPRRGRIQ